MASTAISSYQDLWIFPVANGMQNSDTSRSLVTCGCFPTTLRNREEQYIQPMRNKEKSKNRELVKDIGEQRVEFRKWLV
jgi:hypothetical protein